MIPELSVIIPTYKRTGSLKKLLDILLEQSMINIEIIVVDQNADNYFDNDLLAILRQVKWIKQEKPNASDARNRGFLSSNAPFLLFIDDDLIPEKDFCRRGKDYFLSYTGINSFAPLVYNDEGEGAAIKAAKKKYLVNWPANNEIFSITDTISAAIFFRREYFLLSGGFDDFLFEFAQTAEDQEFFLRMQRKRMTLWFIPMIKVYHDEKVPGGCDLRTDDYWITREKCIKAWVLSYRKQNISGKISTADFIRLCRSCILNREVISSSPKYIVRQVSLMIKGIKKSKVFFEERQNEYIHRAKHGFLN
jgi:glycosyltransferase involved in cell wall biosynthesis